MSFQSLLNNLNDSINLSNTHCTHIFKLWNSLLALRNTASYNDWLFDFLCFTDHIDEGCLRWINNSTTVNEDKVSIFRILNHFVSIFYELSNHEFTIWNVMRTAKGFNEDSMAARGLLAFYYKKCTENRFIFLLFLLVIFLLMLILSFLYFFSFDSLLFSRLWSSFIIIKLEEISSEIF